MVHCVHYCAHIFNTIVWETEQPFSLHHMCISSAPITNMHIGALQQS